MAGGGGVDRDFSRLDLLARGGTTDSFGPWLRPVTNGLLYRGTEFVEAVSENHTAGAYFVEARDGSAVETTLDVRRLGVGAAAR